MATPKPDLQRIWAKNGGAGNVVDPDVLTPGKFESGWVVEQPDYRTFNFVQNQFSSMLSHVNEQGIPVWDINTTYPIAGLTKGSNGTIYKAVSENAGIDPTLGGAQWELGPIDGSTAEQIAQEQAHAGDEQDTGLKNHPVNSLESAKIGDVGLINVTAIRDATANVKYLTSRPVSGEITALDFDARTATIGGVNITLSPYATVSFNSVSGMLLNASLLVGQKCTSGATLWEVQAVPVISLSDFKALTDVYCDDFIINTGDLISDTANMQLALNYQSESGCTLRLIASSYEFGDMTHTASDKGVNKGSLSLHGSSLTGTIINYNGSGILLDISSNQPTTSNRALGVDIKNLSIFGVGATNSWTQTGIRMKGVRLGQFNNVRINNVNGIAMVIGDDLVPNPDDTASGNISFVGCDLDLNGSGIENSISNNAPLMHLQNTSIKNNRRGGIQYNSSYLRLEQCSVAFNGALDFAAATGGINNTSLQPSDAGYRSKGITIVNTELDSNYPYQAKLFRAESSEISGCSIKWEDYNGTAMALVPEFPPAQFVFGGNVLTDKCFGSIFKNNRVSVVYKGNVPINTPHAFVEIGQYGLAIKYENIIPVVSGFTIGTDLVYIREPQKAHTEDRSQYVTYDFPQMNTSDSNFGNAFDVYYKTVFSGYGARNDDNMHFAFSSDKDTVNLIPMPNLQSKYPNSFGYNIMMVTGRGLESGSGMFVMRATGASSAGSVMSANPSAATNFEFAKVTDLGRPPNGTDGTDGKVTFWLDTSQVYLENRVTSENFICSWVMNPGLLNQI